MKTIPEIIDAVRNYDVLRDTLGITSPYAQTSQLCGYVGCIYSLVWELKIGDN